MRVVHLNSGDKQKVTSDKKAGPGAQKQPSQA